MKTLVLTILTACAGTVAFGQAAPAVNKPASAPAATSVTQVAQDATPAAKTEPAAPEKTTSPEKTAAPEKAAAPAKAAETTPATAPTSTQPGAPEKNVSTPNSIEYVGAEIQDVLRTLARQAGLNIVMSEDVQGKVTISLVDVPYEKAITLIADSKGFAIVKEDNIIKVQSKASLAAEPLQEAIITLNYTTAAEAEKLLKPFLTPSRGSVTTDTRSNTIVVSDVPSKLTQIKEIIARIDTQTQQVMIEARVIETSKNPQQAYGIKWDSLNNYEIAARNLGTRFNPLTGHVKTYKGGSPDTTIKQADAAVLTASDFHVLISFLNSNGETELLASPRIVTADNKEAKINIADQFPIPQFTFNQQTASLEVSGFEFKDIGILLGVTPHINKNGFITLELKPEVSSFDPTKLQSFGGAVNAQIPIINTRNLQASVLIKDGHTLALGGLIREDATRSFTKVPVMGDIPGLGSAFRSSNYQRTKRNLLIFITPTVVSPEGAIGQEDEKLAAKGLPDDDFANPKGWRDNAFSKGQQKANDAAASSSK